MTGTAWAQFVVLVVLLIVSIPILGGYMAKVFGEDKKAPGDKVFLPIEHTIYRITRVDPERSSGGRCTRSRCSRSASWGSSSSTSYSGCRRRCVEPDARTEGR